MLRGAAAEIGDWARYLAATEAISGWKEIWTRNESRRLETRAQNTRPYPPDATMDIVGDELEAAEHVIETVLELLRSENWLDDDELYVDAYTEEDTANAALRWAVAIPVLKSYDEGSSTDVEHIARDLETLLASKFEQGSVKVSATRGISAAKVRRERRRIRTSRRPNLSRLWRLRSTRAVSRHRTRHV